MRLREKTRFIRQVSTKSLQVNEGKKMNAMEKNFFLILKFSRLFEQKWKARKGK